MNKIETQEKTQITTSAYQKMLKTVGSKTAESGGLLFGDAHDVITDFVFDKYSINTATSYQINAAYLNPKIDQMLAKKKKLKGIVHSHPPKCTSLSSEDKKYFASQFKNLEVDKLFTPLIFPAVDGTYDFIPYVFYKNGKVVRTELEILPDNYQQYIQKQAELPALEITKESTNAKAFSRLTFSKYYLILWSTLLTGILLLFLALLPTVYTYITNLFNQTL